MRRLKQMNTLKKRNARGQATEGAVYTPGTANRGEGMWSFGVRISTGSGATLRWGIETLPMDQYQRRLQNVERHDQEEKRWSVQRRSVQA
mmetsp:Transcript_25660/g.57889  ORF Transcript_25660/g.57889 Transcript_25660/m.57889 type:complete len:90 (+) Transcript_25660:99-368(+)